MEGDMALLKVLVILVVMEDPHLPAMDTHLILCSICKVAQCLHKRTLPTDHLKEDIMPAHLYIVVGEGHLMRLRACHMNRLLYRSLLSQIL
jgi:hypothetical protein